VTTVSDTDRLPDHEPRLALSLTLERSVAGWPSVAELASLIGVVTMIFELADPDGALRAAVRTPLTVRKAHTGRVEALAVVEHDGAPLIITAGSDGALRSWRVDGSPGPLAVNDLHLGSIDALAVVEHHGAPLIITAGIDGSLRSWRLDGSLGEFTIDGAHPSGIWALAVLEHHGAPLIISPGDDGALRSWRLDGSPGEFSVDGAHLGPINALAVV
jgi:WD40 repeat protein